MDRCTSTTSYGARCVYVSGHRGTHLAPTENFLETYPELAGPIENCESAWLGECGSCFWTLKEKGDFEEFENQATSA